MLRDAGMLVWSVLLLLLGAAVVGIALSARAYFAPVTPTFEFEGPTITQLEKLGEIVTTRVHVADVLTANDGTWKGAWLIKGDALIAVDLMHAKLVEKQLDKKHAIISLPAPHVIQARVDHSKTKTWSVQDTTFLPGWLPIYGSKGNPDVLRDSAMAQAQDCVDHMARSSEALDQSREVASTVITNMYRLVGWQVEIQWQDSATPGQAKTVEK